MRYQIIPAEDYALRGSSYKGCVYCTQHQILDRLGPPASAPSDPYKIALEWCLHFSDGMFASLYSYPMVGAPKPTPWSPYEWHVGSRDPDAVRRVGKLLNVDYEIIDDSINREEGPPF